MKELINNELAQLQKDLENLRSASEMISQAGKASDRVIEETKNIHEDFTKNLDNLTDLYTQFLEAANKQTSQNQLLVVEHVKKTIGEEKSLLNQYSQLVDTSNENTKKLYEKAVESQTQTIAKLMDEANKVIDNQNKQILQNAEEAAKKIETVKQTYLKQSAQTDQLLNSYLELAQSTAELKEKIDAIDFPARITALTAQINSFATQQKNDSEQIKKILEVVNSDKILKQTQSNNSAIKSIKSIVNIILITIIVGVAVLAFLTLKH